MNQMIQKDSCIVYPIIVPVQSSLKSINFYLIKQDQTLILLDAGLNNDKCWNALIDTLHIHDYSLTDLTHIILTHHHMDHVGLVDRICRQHPIPVYAHPASLPRLKRDPSFLNMRVDFFATLYAEMGCQKAGENRVLELKQSIQNNRNDEIKADILPINETHLFHFQCINVPGHAIDQIALFDKERKWLFSGDLLINHISSNAFVEPDPNGNRLYSLLDHKHSLEMALSTNPELLFPGHGIIINNPISTIQKRLAGIENKANTLLTLIEQGTSTAAELAKQYYSQKYEQQFSMVMSEIIGHLDYLDSQNKVQKEMKKGVWHYTI